MLVYQRKPNSGEMVMIPKGVSATKGFRSRRVFAPGDQITVSRKEELPGYPHSIDGWELVRMESNGGGARDSMNARLTPVHQGRGKWKVVIAQPGYDYIDPNTGSPMSPGTKIHPGFIERPRAELWAETGVDPMSEG